MTIDIIVVAGSKTNHIVGRLGDRLKVKITKPAVDGAANHELIRFLAAEWDLPQSAITIRHGHGSKYKMIVA